MIITIKFNRWPIAEGVHTSLESIKDGVDVDIVSTIRNDTKTVYGSNEWWPLIEPLVDSLIVPISHQLYLKYATV